LKDLDTIFKPVRAELEALGFQALKSSNLLYARPLNDRCWCYIQLRGTEEFADPITAFTLPDLGSIVQKFSPIFRAGRGFKDYEGRFAPALLHNEYTLLGEVDPVWGHAAGNRRGQPMGPSELHALAQSIDRFAKDQKDAGWTEDKVVKTMLAAPAMSPHGVMTRWIAPVWFAKRGAWSDFDAYAESLAIPPDDNLKHWREGLDVWNRYAEKVRQHFGQPPRT
jgi:hypothetical protein